MSNLLLSLHSGAPCLLCKSPLSSAQPTVKGLVSSGGFCCSVIVSRYSNGFLEQVNSCFKGLQISLSNT